MPVGNQTNFLRKCEEKATAFLAGNAPISQNIAK
jgi:hypothetical protein